MGKASRRKRERREGLNNPVARTAVKIASRSAVVRELGKASTEDQIEVLGSISPTKVGKALMRKAPHEMDKGIRRLQREGKEVTVKELCREIRETPSFLIMSENAGVPYGWYEELAEERIKARVVAKRGENKIGGAKVARVITWYKQSRYQWVREDFHKVFDKLWWGMFAIMIVGGITLFLLGHFGASRDTLLIAVAIGYIFLFVTLGGAYAVRWADEKLKDR